MKKGLAAIAVLVAVLAEAAGAATTSIAEHGTTLVDGRKVFPIVLAKGPEGDGLDEVVDAGVNFLKVGPASTPWVPADFTDALERNREAAARGIYTWVNLATLADATPDTPVKDARLREVISRLESDSSATALAMWKGADEPQLAGFEPEELQYAYCVATSRGEPSWCGGRPTADEEHLWVTIQAPRGTAAQLAPYGAVTDIHGVDHYPVTAANPDPDLHEIGLWTERIRSITPNRAVWTTLQVCASGSSKPDGSFVMPTRLQERYMIYDAIINGARSLAFYGGNLPRCWTEADTTRGWNWTFWDAVLEDLVREISAESPIAPALVNGGSTTTLASSDPTTQVIRREGSSTSELWVIAARHGAGTQTVTITGLPATVGEGTVYTESRSVDVANGSFTDTFSRWDVHVYRFEVPTPPSPAPPAPHPPDPCDDRQGLEGDGRRRQLRRPRRQGTSSRRSAWLAQRSRLLHVDGPETRPRKGIPWRHPGCERGVGGHPPLRRARQLDLMRAPSRAAWSAAAERFRASAAPLRSRSGASSSCALVGSSRSRIHSSVATAPPHPRRPRLSHGRGAAASRGGSARRRSRQAAGDAVRGRARTAPRRSLPGQPARLCEL